MENVNEWAERTHLDVRLGDAVELLRLGKSWEAFTGLMETGSCVVKVVLDPETRQVRFEKVMPINMAAWSIAPSTADEIVEENLTHPQELHDRMVGTPVESEPSPERDGDIEHLTPTIIDEAESKKASEQYGIPITVFKPKLPEKEPMTESRHAPLPTVPEPPTPEPEKKSEPVKKRKRF